MNPVMRRMPLANLCNRLVVNEHPTVPSARKWGACGPANRLLLTPLLPTRTNVHAWERTLHRGHWIARRHLQT